MLKQTQVASWVPILLPLCLCATFVLAYLLATDSISLDREPNETPPNHTPTNTSYLNAPTAELTFRDGVARSCDGELLGSPVCPKLFLVGCKKCGTTVLWRSIEHSPHMRPALDPATRKPVKELSFFLGHQDMSKPREARAVAEEQYLSRFPPRASAEEWSMDATPGYMFKPNALDVMQAAGVVRPGSRARFLFVLRKPSQRALSELYWFARHARKQGETMKVNYTRSAEICVPRVQQCRREAKQAQRRADKPHWKNLPYYYCEEHLGTRDLCHLFYRGFYVDILKRHLMAGFDPHKEMCVFGMNEMIQSPVAAFRKQNAFKRCLSPYLTDDDFPDHITQEHANFHDNGDAQIDEQWPGTREYVQTLFEESNQELRDLLSADFGIEWTEF